MKVLNLACSRAHLFEGWFSSEDDFQNQLSRGLVECPMCGDKSIEKRLSAPRLNLRSADVDSRSIDALQPQAQSAPTEAQLQALMMKAMRELAANTEDVGERFATEARRMHYGETDARNIRGQASMTDALELLEEGIDVLPLPNLPALNDTLQ